MPFRLRSSYGRNYPIDRLLYIGRDETCQIRPPDSLVSRVHAAVWVDRGVVQVRDEHASNGTFVNGTRLAAGQTRSLRAGDQLQVGDSLFTLDGAATSAADLETLVEPPAAEPPTAPDAPPTIRAPELVPAPTQAAPLPAGLAEAPPAARPRGLRWPLVAAVGCLALALLCLCLVFAFLLTPPGQELLARLFGG
ncbi:MAG: FHA domain-containing protein [Anaerolineales bacterium]|nr:FHA domain-containing protein [Anaerolineales bacterium]